MAPLVAWWRHHSLWDSTDAREAESENARRAHLYVNGESELNLIPLARSLCMTRGGPPNDRLAFLGTQGTDSLRQSHDIPNLARTFSLICTNDSITLDIEVRGAAEARARWRRGGKTLWKEAW